MDGPCHKLWIVRCSPVTRDEALRCGRIFSGLDRGSLHISNDLIVNSNTRDDGVDLVVFENRL